MSWTNRNPPPPYPRPAKAAPTTRRFDQSNLPQRMWINQPSSLQPLHALHGTNVLAVHDYDDVMRVYFLAGDVVSQQAPRLALSNGWLEPSPTGRGVLPYVPPFHNFPKT